MSVDETASQSTERADDHLLKSMDDRTSRRDAAAFTKSNRPSAITMINAHVDALEERHARTEREACMRAEEVGRLRQEIDKLRALSSDQARRLDSVRQVRDRLAGQLVDARQALGVPFTESLVDEIEKLRPQARPAAEYHEDLGSVLWWRFPVEEPPYVGSPLDTDWIDDFTHFSPLVMPEFPHA